MHLFLQTLYMLAVMVTTAMLMIMVLVFTPDVHYRLTAENRPSMVDKSFEQDGRIEKEFSNTETDLSGRSARATVARREVAWSYSTTNAGFLKQVIDFERPQHAMWGADEGICASLKVRFARRKTLPRTALASFPGSGNTWLRYLIEGFTGLFTGSIYNDRQLAAKGFYGEGATPECGCTIAVKSHGYCLMGLPMDRTLRLKDQNRFFRRALLLLRNPYDTLVAYRNFQVAGHLGVAPASAFVHDDWDKFVRIHVMIWRSYAMDWLMHGKSIEVVHFEKLQQNLTREIDRVISFLKVRPDSTRIKCTLQYPNGFFKRSTPEDAPYKRQDPFTDEHHDLIDSAINDINNILTNMGLDQLPIESYGYMAHETSNVSKTLPSPERKHALRERTALPETKHALRERTDERFSQLIVTRTKKDPNEEDRILVV